MNGYQITFFTQQQLFDRLKSERVHLFYVKTPVEFGSLGEAGE